MGTKAEYPAAIIDPKIDPLCSVPCILCYVSCILCHVYSAMCPQCTVHHCVHCSVIIVGKIDLLSGFRPDSCLGDCLYYCTIFDVVLCSVRH